jgi:hypothetical protein
MNPRIRELTIEAQQGYPSQNEFLERFAQLVAEDCAKIAREYTLKNSGLSADYTGEVMIQNEILKLYASDSSDFVKMKENVA